jgi:hypothetical protein
MGISHFPLGSYWENRPNHYFVETHDWRPLNNTQMYAMSRLLIITLSI